MKHILAFLNTYSQGKSGGDVCFVEIYRRMKDVELTIVTSQLGKEFCEKNGLKANFIITTKESTFSNPVFTYIKRIWKSFFLNANLSHVTTIYSTSDGLPDTLAAWWLSIRYKKCWIGNIFHFVPNDRMLSFITQKLSHYLLKTKAHIIFVDNKKLKKVLIHKKFKEEQLVVRYPGIEIHGIQQIKPKRKYDAVFKSRLHPSKGIYDLIEIWKLVIQTRPEARLGIIGSGEEVYIRTLKQRINEEQLEKNIFVLGFVEDRESVALIKGSRVFLFPSHEEGFGMTIGEALQCEVPVIAYNLPVYKETFSTFIHTIACFDTTAFAIKILQLLKSSKQKMVNQQLLDRFSWSNAVEIERKYL